MKEWYGAKAKRYGRKILDVYKEYRYGIYFVHFPSYIKFRDKMISFSIVYKTRSIIIGYLWNLPFLFHWYYARIQPNLFLQLSQNKQFTIHAKNIYYFRHLFKEKFHEDLFFHEFLIYFKQKLQLLEYLRCLYDKLWRQTQKSLSQTISLTP